MATQGFEFARVFGMNPEAHQAVGMMSVQIDDSLEAAAMPLLVAADADGCSPDCIAADVVARRRRFTRQS